MIHVNNYKSKYYLRFENPKHTINDNYKIHTLRLLLDLSRAETDTDTTQYKFILSTDTNAKHAKDNQVFIKRALHNIVELKLLPFAFRDLSMVNLNNTNMLSVKIDEITDRLYSGGDFHFLFNAYDELNKMYGVNLDTSSPSRTSNIIKFDEPLNELNTITLMFGDPYTRISDKFTVLSYNVISILQQGLDASLTLAPGQLDQRKLFPMIARISGFTTDQPALDAAKIAEVNSIEYTITAITYPGYLTIPNYSFNTQGIIDFTNFIIYTQTVLPIIPIEIKYLEFIDS